MENYKKVKRIGHGSHGTVVKCLCVEDEDEKEKFVAIKKLKRPIITNECGLNSQTIRELMFAQELVHPHIIDVYEIFNKNKKINVVFEFMETNLENVIHNGKIRYTEANVKAFLKMILKAVDYCHSNFVMHRDLKPSNCLISATGILKISDFGLAKSFGDLNSKFSPEACTLWYRAPELLFGAKYYGPAMDIWSIGCIFAEMLLRKVIFPGDRTVISQLSTIFSILGVPTKTNWPNASSLPYYFDFENNTQVNLRDIFVDSTEEAIDLFSKMCKLDPTQRLTANEALSHSYFKSFPNERNLNMRTIFSD